MKHSQKFLAYIAFICCIVIAFLIYCYYFDEHSIQRIQKYQHEIDSLKAEIVRYQEIYDKATLQMNELEENPEALERLAREKFFMHKADEDVFVFESDLIRSDSIQKSVY